MNRESLRLGEVKSLSCKHHFLDSVAPPRHHLRRPSSGEPAAAELSAIHLRLPIYWPADPQIWFAQVESQFATSRITAQVQRFHRVIAAEIKDLILTLPANSLYGALKAQLIRRTTSTEQRSLQQLFTLEEVSDHKPSQLLPRLQQLLGGKVPTFDVALLRELFLQRLPTNVRMVLVSAAGLDLEKLAKLADSIMQVAVPTVAQVQDQTRPRPTSTSPAGMTTPVSDVSGLREKFHCEVRRLSTLIAALSARLPTNQRRKSTS